MNKKLKSEKDISAVFPTAIKELMENELKEQISNMSKRGLNYEQR